MLPIAQRRVPVILNARIGMAFAYLPLARTMPSDRVYRVAMTPQQIFGEPGQAAADIQATLFFVPD
mgnify:CR=1 FL=1